MVLQVERMGTPCQFTSVWVFTIPWAMRNFWSGRFWPALADFASACMMRSDGRCAKQPDGD